LPKSVGLLMVLGALAWLGFERIGAILLDSDSLWVVGPVLMGAGFAWLGYSLWSMTPTSQAVRLRTPRVVAGSRSPA
jgi:hypothetical protein